LLFPNLIQNLGFLVNQVWFAQFIFNIIAYALMWIYVTLITAKDLFRGSDRDFLVNLGIYNAIAILFFAFLEKVNSKNLKGNIYIET